MKQIDDFTNKVTRDLKRYFTQDITQREPLESIISRSKEELVKLIKECCELQKRECADKAKPMFNFSYKMVVFKSEEDSLKCIDRNSILNCKNIVDE